MPYAMPYDVRQVSTVFAPPGDARETERVQACNRLLLYMRGLDIRAQPSLQLAMESMRRAGPDADIGKIMAEMHGLLREHGVDLRINDEQGRPLRSVAPMNRRSMLSGDMSRDSVYGWMRKLIRRKAGA